MAIEKALEWCGGDGYLPVRKCDVRRIRYLRAFNDMLEHRMGKEIVMEGVCKDICQNNKGFFGRKGYEGMLQERTTGNKVRFESKNGKNLEEHVIMFRDYSQRYELPVKVEGILKGDKGNYVLKVKSVNILPGVLWGRSRK
jgi:hypothetical protein